MNFGLSTYGLGLAARALSTLSPCVLPLVPVLLASAANAHRWGPVALGTGLALSFALIGTFLATVGAALGLDPDTFRSIGAAVLAPFGLILLVPKLQAVFGAAMSGLSSSGHQLPARITSTDLPDNSSLDSFSGRSGAPVSVLLWEPRRVGEPR